MRLRLSLAVVMLTFGITLGALSAETIRADNLVIRDGLLFKKFTDTPFTGKVVGETIATLQHGKPIGTILEFYKSGVLKGKFSVIDGFREGTTSYFWENGKIMSLRNFKKGKLDGLYVDYFQDGNIQTQSNWKEGTLEGLVLQYYLNGQLLRKGNFKEDVRDGRWSKYNPDGTIDKKHTGIYEKGEKISD